MKDINIEYESEQFQLMLDEFTSSYEYSYIDDIKHYKNVLLDLNKGDRYFKADISQHLENIDEILDELTEFEVNERLADAKK
jgi:hypothetical protein